MKLTELEGCVLGFIAAEGPQTPYAVRQQLKDSPSRHWSGSAGAVYPLVRRLERRRLIAAERVAGDGRGGKRYSLTADGRKAFRTWLSAGPAVADVPPDPLRTRVAFLRTLDSAAAAAFLANAVKEARNHLGVLRDFASKVESRGDEHETLLCRGGVLAAEARLNWLIEVQASFKSK